MCIHIKCFNVKLRRSSIMLHHNNNNNNNSDVRTDEEFERSHSTAKRHQLPSNFDLTNS